MLIAHDVRELSLRRDPVVLIPVVWRGSEGDILRVTLIIRSVGSVEKS